MTDRRNFLSALSAGGAWLARPKWLDAKPDVLSVTAESTVFFAHPDGERNLVRFEVNGIDAPAGRLRIFDRSRRLLGTAGLLRTGGNLYGELWMQIAEPIRAVSELEAPGVSGPFRTNHLIAPGRRWTIHLMTVADPDSLLSSLGALRPINRAVQTALYRDSSVTVNPLRLSVVSRQEHIPFLRMAEGALQVERQCAIRVGPAAYVPPGVHLPSTGALALAGAGVKILLCEREAGNPFEWWEVPGGSRLLVVSVPEGSSPRSLGFDLSQNEMTLRIEEWLSSTALRFSPSESSGTAVILNANPEEALSASLETIDNWNTRFAYPRIVIGDHQVLIEDMDSGTTEPAAVEPSAIHVPGPPSSRELVLVRESRNSLSGKRAIDLATVLGHAVDPSLAGFDAVAPYLATAVPGSMVFNPSPYQHSDLVRMSDGSERLATNVPGLGYAFFPDVRITGETGGWEPSDAGYSATGQELRLTIDQSSGSIASLTQLADGKEWVGAGSDGLNAVDDARLLKIEAERLSGIATRLVVTRWAPSVGTFTSSVTLYDELPWLSLVNETEIVAHQEATYDFHLALPEPVVSWELPAGREQAELPVRALEHLRWISLGGRDGTLMFRAFDAPIASIDLDATLRSVAPRGLSRYRLAPLPRYSNEDMPWVFGWDSEPMVITRVEPNGREVLPRYGSLFEIDQVGVAMLGVQPAADHIGAVLYLQETLGVSRTVSVGPGILQFSLAETVDFIERYLERLNVDASGRIRVPLPANSVVAIRVSGLEVSTG